MVDAQASAAGRELARCRWASRGVDRAIEVLETRRDEIGDAQRARLAEVIDAPAPGQDTEG